MNYVYPQGRKWGSCTADVNHRDTDDTEFSYGGGLRVPVFVRPAECPRP